MEQLRITETYCTPEVHLDRENGSLFFSGRFNPLEGLYYYAPVIRWIKEYAKDPHTSTSVKIYVESISTSSAKFLVLIFRLLMEIHDKKKDVLLEWFYYDVDEIMDWENFLRNYSFPISFCKIEEEIVA